MVERYSTARLPLPSDRNMRSAVPGKSGEALLPLETLRPVQDRSEPPPPPSPQAFSSHSSLFLFMSAFPKTERPFSREIAFSSH